MRRRQLRIWLVLAIVLATLFSSTRVPAQSPMRTQLLNIAPDRDVDKNLFLLQALEHTYATWPVPSAGTTGLLPQWIATTRVTLTKLKKDAEVDGLDKDIVALYEDALKLIDSYDSFLTNIGILRAVALKPAGGVAIVTDALAAGSEVGTMVGTFGGPIAGVAVGGLTTLGAAAAGFYVQNNAQKAVDQQQKQFFDQSLQALVSRVDAVLAGANTIAHKKKDKYAWAEYPTFDLSSLSNRSNDPFVVTRLAANASTGSKLSSSELVALSDKCIRTSKRIPGGKAFDIYRASVLWQAGKLRTAAAREKLRASGFLVPEVLGDQANRLFATAAALVERTAISDYMRYEHCSALMQAGRFDEAFDLFNAISSMKNDPRYSYDYACVLSRVGRPQAALEWLPWSYQKGNRYDGWARQDPDLDSVRAALPKEFDELVTPKTTWSLNWNRFLGDSVKLTNGSPFPLTNVSLRLTVTSKGFADFEETFATPELAPGATQTWKCKITSRGADATSSADVDCDQDHVRAAFSRGPLPHPDGKGDYRCGPVSVRFLVSTARVGPLPAGTLPSAEDIPKSNPMPADPGHAANTAYFYQLLDPSMLLVAKAVCDGLEIADTVYVYRDSSDNWYYARGDRVWKELSLCAEAGAIFLLPNNEVHIDVVRPEIDENDPDREIDYRFRVLKKETYFPKVTELVANGAAAQAGVRVGDTILTYAGQTVGARSTANNPLKEAVEGSPHRAVPLNIIRDGRVEKLTVPGGTALGVAFQLQK